MKIRKAFAQLYSSKGFFKFKTKHNTFWLQKTSIINGGSKQSEQPAWIPTRTRPTDKISTNDNSSKAKKYAKLLFETAQDDKLADNRTSNWIRQPITAGKDE